MVTSHELPIILTTAERNASILGLLFSFFLFKYLHNNQGCSVSAGALSLQLESMAQIIPTEALWIGIKMRKTI